LFSIFLQAHAQTSRESSGIASGAWGGEHIILEVSEQPATPVMSTATP
jgi:hypothetical protein